MRSRPIIAANWKMNPAPAGFDTKDSPYRTQKDVTVVVFPTYLDLAACLEAGLLTGPQFGHAEASGAHTGDCSLAMAKALGCTYALCGHSDRRRDHGETDAFVAAQAQMALRLRLIPIVCTGETAEERASGKAQETVRRQVEAVPQGVTIIAYEPVWAISRGDPTKPAATVEEAQNMHHFIRSLLPASRKETAILYGGSMNGSNAAELLAQPDIDGGLVGGASLKPDEFAKIVAAARS